MDSRRQRFSSVDSAWLRMDEPENLMVVNAVLVLQEPVPFERYQTLIADRLDLLPRLRHRVVKFGKWPGALDWETDPDFDLSHHVHLAPLEKPDQPSLQHLVGRLMSVQFDPQRPPWQLHFVPQYEGGSAVIVRIHHCVGDGVALLHMLLVLTDDPPVERSTNPPAPAPAVARSALVRLLTRLVSLPVSFARAVGKLVTLVVTGIIAGLAGLLRGVRSLPRWVASAAKLLLMRPVPKTVLKGPLSEHKCAVWSRPMPMSALKALAHATDSTINDVVLAAIAGGLREYLLARGQKVKGLKVRAVVPVNLRRQEEAENLGNHFGLDFVPLPLATADPLGRIAKVRSATRKVKQTPEARLTFLILQILGRLPKPLFEFVVSFFGHRSTVVMTNVIGPRRPLRMAGATLEHAVFWVPCAGRLGLGFSVFSYAGNIWLGVATDGSLVPDPEVIVDGFESEIAAFFERTGLARPGPLDLPAAGSLAAASSSPRTPVSSTPLASASTHADVTA